MANEKQLDLIARKALLKTLDRYINPMPNESGYEFLRGIATAITEIEDSPAVDAMEVVRCKDCAFYIYEGVGSSTLKRFGRCAKWYPFGNEQHSCHDDDFCSYGERREGE